MNTKTTSKRRLIVTLAILASLLGGSFISTQTASAGGRPISRTNGWAPNYYAPFANIHHWSAPNTKLYMLCWFDHGGRRWFWIQIFDNGGYYYMPSNYVKNQVWTPHC